MFAGTLTITDQLQDQSSHIWKEVFVLINLLPAKILQQFSVIVFILELILWQDPRIVYSFLLSLSSEEYV